MERTVNSFPIQRLPLSKKTEEWRKDCVDYIIGISGIASSDSIPDEEEMQSYYDLYNSIYNEKDLKYVTNPFNQDDGFPAMAQDYNIIRPKVDLLLGEETKRPFNFRVCRTSDIASSEVQDKAKQMLLNYMQAAMLAKLSPEDQARFQEGLQTGEIQTPEQIQKYLTKDYKDAAETTAYQSLLFLLKKENISHEFMKGFKDALVAGLEEYYIGIRNGEPVIKRINPKDFKYPAEEGIEFIHDASWCCYRSLMSWSQIYDQFYDKLDEKQLNELLEIVDQKPTSGFGPDKSPVDDFVHYNLKSYNKLPDHNPYGDPDNIVVYHVCWKSLKKIGFVTIIDPETGMPDEIQVDEYYKPTGEEINVEWKWIIEAWEGYRAGDDLYFGMQPLEYQFRRGDNLNSAKLPYTGAAYSNTNTKAKSLVAIMKPLQYMYIILWYRLEMAIARDKGKIPVIDVTQIPKSMGIDVDKWMHYLGALGVAFVNPYEEGWDIPGREGGKPSPYTGAAYSNTNTKAKSLVAIMKPLQYMYIILWYRLEMAIARDKGKIPVIDVTQIPKSMGIDVDKWMHYLGALGVAFVNPYEEGWDIPGREGGKPSPYNQWTSIDASMSNTINTYIQLLAKIEEMVSELSGVTKQRQGSISSNELVGNVERSVVQSAHITEPWFWLHNQIKTHVLSMLLDSAKFAWKDDKKYLNYIFDEGTRTFLQMDDNWSYEDFDIFVTDSTKESQAIEQLKSLVQPAMQNGASLLDAAEIFTSDNLSVIKSKLQDIENNRLEQQQAMQEQENQQQQQLVEMQNQVKEEELMLKEAELDLTKYKIDQDNATKITVAQLNAYRGSENMDQDMNGVPDVIEIGNQEIARQKAVSDAMSKQMDLANKARAEENKKELEKRKIAAQEKADKLKATIEKEKIALENRKLQEAKRLQKMKDDAAYKREQLKAKTALKNKTNAEAARSKKK